MGDTIYGAQCEPMRKGQAENLMGFLETALKAGGISYKDLTAIAVGIGPGNFTGIRISVSAARGLALSLGIPAIGVSSFEVMRDPSDLTGHSAEIVSVAAMHDQAFVQRFQHGVPQGAPHSIEPSDPTSWPLQITPDMRVRGFRANDIAAPFGATASPALAEDIGPRIARCAASRLASLGETPATRPAPLYVRPADAAPPRDPAPVILD